MSFEPIPKVEGVITSGNALGITKPVLVGGKDCTGLAQPLPICSATPSEGALAVYITPRPISVFRDSFSDTLVNNINSNWDIISKGAGQTINQTGGNLILTSGTTPNEEIILRTKMSWEDAYTLRYLIASSSYQANAKTTFEMVDVIGNNLAVTSSTTAVSITKVGHGFTSINIGQSVFIGGLKSIVGGGVIIPGQWAIASITSADVFVVTATGSTGTVTGGTVCVWGYNSIRMQYNASSLTTANINSTRKGWNSAADTSVTVTTAATASYNMWSVNDGVITFNETTNNATGLSNLRGIRTTATPGSDQELHLQIRLTVGTSAPTALTVTIGMISIEDINSISIDTPVSKGTNSGATAIPVNVTSMPSTTVTGTVAVAGTQAADSATAVNVVKVGGIARVANTTVTAGRASEMTMTSVGAQIAKLYSIPELDFGIQDTITNSSTAKQVRAALASNHAYVTGLQIATGALSGSTSFQIRSTPVASTTATIASNTLVMAGTYGWKVGELVYVTASTVTGLTAGNYYYLLTVSTTSLTFSTSRGGSVLTISGTAVVATLTKVMFRTTLGTTALPLINIPFTNPLSGGAGLAIEAITLPAVTGDVDFNVQGYAAP